MAAEEQNQMTAKVMLIRHGEKPVVSPDGAGSCGLLETGERSNHGLTVRGWQRAGALALFFGREGEGFRPPSLATPDRIFATATGPGSWSLRMQQTVAPLQQKLGSAVVLDTRYKKGEEEAMAAAAMQGGGNVLICWSHEGIPRIAREILGESNAAPNVWPEDRFDLVWVFDCKSGSRDWTFLQTPQLLLAGDRSEAIV
jgi:hypothetical protein